MRMLLSAFGLFLWAAQSAAALPLSATLGDPGREPLLRVAATVVASTPYQKAGSSICTPSDCEFTFPKVAVGQRLDVQFVSCRLYGQALVIGDAMLGVDAGLTPKLFLAGVDRNVGGTAYYIVSQPVALSIPAKHRPDIRIYFTATSLNAQQCTLVGTLQTLN